MQVSPAYLAEYFIYLIGIIVILIMLFHHVFAQERVAVRRPKRRKK